jgi:hypothetical protein
VFSWDITTQWNLETDLEKTSEIEVRFIAEGPARTRVELEHRNLDRHGAGWKGMRDAVGSPEGWPDGLKDFAERLKIGSVARRPSPSSRADAPPQVVIERRAPHAPYVARRSNVSRWRSTIARYVAIGSSSAAGYGRSSSEPSSRFSLSSSATVRWSHATAGSCDLSIRSAANAAKFDLLAPFWRPPCPDLAL